jgi:hypothetical protein
MDVDDVDTPALTKHPKGELGLNEPDPKIPL